LVLGCYKLMVLLAQMSHYIPSVLLYLPYALLFSFLSYFL
jgi:hypothetical protein